MATSRLVPPALALCWHVALVIAPCPGEYHTAVVCQLSLVGLVIVKEPDASQVTDSWRLLECSVGGEYATGLLTGL